MSHHATKKKGERQYVKLVYYSCSYYSTSFFQSIDFAKIIERII